MAPNIPPRKKIIDAFVNELGGFISSVSSKERCAALVVANALLLKGASVWGREISHQPMKIKPENINAALTALQQRYSQLEGTFDMTDGSAIDDVYVMACKWEMLATQIVMVTIAASVNKQYAVTARNSWQALGKSRHSSKEAVTILLEYSKKYNDSPIPLTAGRKLSAEYLNALATNLPPMFSSKKKAPDKK